MAERENTHHFDGDDCAAYGLGARVETDAGSRNVEDLVDGSVWRDPARDATDVWWYVNEVVVVDNVAGPEVHVDYEAA
jgi:hypothetical protein